MPPVRQPDELAHLCEGLSQLPLDVLKLRLPCEGLAGKAVRIDLGKGSDITVQLKLVADFSPP